MKVLAIATLTLATTVSAAEWGESSLKIVQSVCTDLVSQQQRADKYYVDAICSCVMGSLVTWDRVDDFARQKEEEMYSRITDHIMFCAAGVSGISLKDKEIYYQQRKNGGAR